MTPYELIDLAQSTYGNGTAAYGVFLTVVTAYLVTAYVVGAELSRYQVTVLTILFLLVTGILVFTISSYVFYGNHYSVLARAAALGAEAEGPTWAPKQWFPAFLTIVNVTTVVASLSFMWKSRTAKK